MCVEENMVPKSTPVTAIQPFFQPDAKSSFLLYVNPLLDETWRY